MSSATDNLNTGRRQRRGNNRGMALAMTIMLMGLFFAIMLALSQVSRANLRQAGNHEDGFRAQLAAESGLNYLTHIMKQCKFTYVASNDHQILETLSNFLKTNLDANNAMSGQTIVFTGNDIFIPESTARSTGGTFRARISSTADSESDVFLRVVGRFGQTTRTVQMKFSHELCTKIFFEYGLATNGTICFNGSSILRGLNDPSEANVLTTMMNQDLVFTMNGAGIIEGDLYATNPFAYFRLRGACSIGGEYNNTPYILDHIHSGIPEVDMPEVDPTPYLQAVTLTDVTATTDTSSSTTFSNIRIKAGTNKSFPSGTTLNGVIYVEAPNDLSFIGSTTVNGVIISEKTADSGSITFNGGVHFTGMDNLPDTSEFAALKKLEGSALLTPKFNIIFNGSSNINGYVAVNNLLFNGSTMGIVKGGIICYGTENLWFNGSQYFLFDKSGMDNSAPPGFTGKSTFVPLASSYQDFSSVAN